MSWGIIYKLNPETCELPVPGNPSGIGSFLSWILCFIPFSLFHLEYISFKYLPYYKTLCSWFSSGNWVSKTNVPTSSSNIFLWIVSHQSHKLYHSLHIFLFSLYIDIFKVTNQLGEILFLIILSFHRCYFQVQSCFCFNLISFQAFI